MYVPSFWISVLNCQSNIQDLVLECRTILDDEMSVSICMYVDT